VIIGLMFTLIFTIALGAILIQMPSMRIYEDIICHHYYNGLEGKEHIRLDEYIDEERCKGDVVQNQLNTLFGTLNFLSPIPGTTVHRRESSLFMFVFGLYSL
jgi:hypothetical protein